MLVELATHFHGILLFEVFLYSLDDRPVFVQLHEIHHSVITCLISQHSW